MSTDLPDLEPGQFASIQTDPRTGVPLTSDGQWTTADPAKRTAIHAEVFSSLESAEAACVSRIRKHPDSEWWIYDHLGKPVKGIRDPDHWRSLDSPERSLWRRLLRWLKPSH